jgi:hypothetical protein
MDERNRYMETTLQSTRFLNPSITRLPHLNPSCLTLHMYFDKTIYPSSKPTHSSCSERFTLSLRTVSQVVASQNYFQLKGILHACTFSAIIRLIY